MQTAVERYKNFQLKLYRSAGPKFTGFLRIFCLFPLKLYRSAGILLEALKEFASQLSYSSIEVRVLQ
jgi:hypothetical protein